MHAEQTGYSLGPFVLLTGQLVLCWARLYYPLPRRSVMVPRCYNSALLILLRHRRLPASRTKVNYRRCTIRFRLESNADDFAQDQLAFIVSQPHCLPRGTGSVLTGVPSFLRNTASSPLATSSVAGRAQEFWSRAGPHPMRPSPPMPSWARRTHDEWKSAGDFRHLLGRQKQASCMA